MGFDRVTVVPADVRDQEPSVAAAIARLCQLNPGAPDRRMGQMICASTRHARRPAINALVTAGDGPSITAQSCFSRHLGPGPRI